MRVLRDGAKVSNKSDVATALDLHRKGYADVYVKTSKRIGRYGDPLFFEWRGRTASGDALLAAFDARQRRFRK